MAPFLNKQRRSIGAPGAFFGYLKYAFGEIVLLVVDILVALQINDWYQERLDRKTEREYLVSMKRDPGEDTRELRAAIDGNASLLTGPGNTLRLLSEPRDDEPLLLADYFDDMLYYRTALNILALMYQRQLGLAESLSTIIEAQYGIGNPAS
jgi:hypothetical protein